MRYRPKSASTNRIGQGDRDGLETSRSSTIDTAVDDHGRNGDGDAPGDGAQKRKGEMIVVDWYGHDDPENPQNWYVTPFSLNRVSCSCGRGGGQTLLGLDQEDHEDTIMNSRIWRTT